MHPDVAELLLAITQGTEVADVTLTLEVVYVCARALPGDAREDAEVLFISQAEVTLEQVDGTQLLQVGEG